MGLANVQRPSMLLTHFYSKSSAGEVINKPGTFHEMIQSDVNCEVYIRRPIEKTRLEISAFTISVVSNDSLGAFTLVKSLSPRLLLKADKKPALYFIFFGKTITRVSRHECVSSSAEALCVEHDWGEILTFRIHRAIN